MVQRATQGKAVAAVCPYGQGKDRHTTCAGSQHITHHAVAQRHTAAGQSLRGQTADITAKTKAACPISTEVDQVIEGPSCAAGAHTLTRPFVVAAGQRIFLHLTTNLGPLILSPRQHRHIIFNLDGKAPRREATCQRVTVTVGGGQHAREVNAHASQLFAVITICNRMVQRATQGKAVAAVCPYGQGKDRHTTCAGSQHITHHAVAQRHTAAGQSLRGQTADITAKTKAACPISTEVDQVIEGPSCAAGAHTLTRPFVVAAGQRIFLHLTTQS